VRDPGIGWDWGPGTKTAQRCQNEDVSDSVYFEGDPSTDSTRRHMERVLKGERTARWPWLLAALGSGAVWTFWRMGRIAAERKKDASGIDMDTGR
jgi:hypothetical protein